ncbi:MAG: dihydroorotate dehydrogenase electron transfer subunit [Planctomycetes bacterium]|nr:dihydroorotate dehydrogenase electron transfer subunit [Planctomycetota bacterium]
MTIHNLPTQLVSRIKTREGFIITLKIDKKIDFFPGQFLHLRIDSQRYDPLLRRPFSIWNYSHKNSSTYIDVLFKVVGRGTDILAKEDNLKPFVMIPLGNKFNILNDRSNYIMVAGGAGIVPFYLLGRELVKMHKGKVTLIFGARNSSQLYGLEQLSSLGLDMHICTDDGSEGKKGLVTEILDELLGKQKTDSIQAFSCGPMVMLKRVSEVCNKWNVGCQLSLETHMGCALGACRACIVKVKNKDDWKYSRVCCEGPNYNSSELIWE